MGDIAKVYTRGSHASALVDARRLSRPEGCGGAAESGCHARFLAPSFGQRIEADV